MLHSAKQIKKCRPMYQGSWGAMKVEADDVAVAGGGKVNYLGLRSSEAEVEAQKREEVVVEQGTAEQPDYTFKKSDHKFGDEEAGRLVLVAVASPNIDHGQDAVSLPGSTLR